jgi:hypothetical protein
MQSRAIFDSAIGKRRGGNSQLNCPAPMSYRHLKAQNMSHSRVAKGEIPLATRLKNYYISKSYNKFNVLPVNLPLSVFLHQGIRFAIVAPQPPPEGPAS